MRRCSTHFTVHFYFCFYYFKINVLKYQNLWPKSIISKQNCIISEEVIISQNLDVTQQVKSCRLSLNLKTLSTRITWYQSLVFHCLLGEPWTLIPVYRRHKSRSLLNAGPTSGDVGPALSKLLFSTNASGRAEKRMIVISGAFVMDPQATLGTNKTRHRSHVPDGTGKNVIKASFCPEIRFKVVYYWRRRDVCQDCEVWGDWTKRGSFDTSTPSGCFCLVFAGVTMRFGLCVLLVVTRRPQLIDLPGCTALL